MPLLAAWMVLTPLDIESSRLVKSVARFDKPWAVKKLIGLSSAELTRLPVASLDWVLVINAEVDCSWSRFERTPALRTMSAMVVSLSGMSADRERRNDLRSPQDQRP